MIFGTRNEINHHMSLVLEFLEDSRNIILQYPALSGPDSHRLVLTHWTNTCEWETATTKKKGRFQEYIPMPILVYFISK